MSSLSRELVFLILQFLEEEKFKETVHRLEQESGFFFNMKYFEEKILAGEWDEVEKYLSGFTKVDDNRYSMKIFFEIRKQKYLEALDRNDRAKAVEILVKDLKVFSTFNEELLKEITHLLTLGNFRENEQLSKYGDTKSARSIMLIELKKLIEANPLFREKLVFPTLKASRLRTLINQSLNWQHQLCKNPKPNPDIKTLFTDHSCSPPNGARAPTPVTFPVAAVAKPSTYAPVGAHVHHVSVLKHPRTPSNTPGMVEYGSTDHEHLMKRLRSAQSIDEVTYPAPPQHASWSLDDLPKSVACTIHQGSNVTSMDFHPFHHTLLTVGCSNGEISLWEVSKRERLLTKPFKIRDMASCSVLLQASIVKDSSISVNRVAWTPDGNLIAFSHPNKKLCVVTCGDDKLIKVWDLAGNKLFSFEGHESPVYSVCPHQKENIQFIFSTAIDGKIKAWLYDNMGSRVDYDAPGQWCTRMLYSADGSRLFSCGTSKDGDSFLVEWNESEGKIRRAFSGFKKNSPGVVQFDTTKNRFLAVGDDSQIKFWDMDNTNILTSTEAEGGLPSRPRLRFNKEGNLLVVTTADNGFKVLANANGLRALRAMEAQSYEASRTPLEMKVSSSFMLTSIGPVVSKVERVDSPAKPTSTLNGVEPMIRGIEKPRNLEDVSDKTKPWELTEIVDPTQCRTVTLPDNSEIASKVARLLYTNSGVGVLALYTNGVQKLWKWSRSEQNSSGKATASIIPQLWQPNSGLHMTNDVPENSEDAVPCIALSKNDSYVMSACGGKVSLFNMMTFKVMTTFMPPPPASTFLAFHPQDNNIIAIGMEDSAIHIYNVRVDEVKTKLKGHQKRITGLAFSTSLNLLASSGADAQLFFWNMENWEKMKSVALQLPPGRTPQGATRVQFHSDQVRLLVCHETQLAVYDANKMECIQQWMPQEVLSSPICSAAYSCNSQLVYATFPDGNIGVFDADSLKLRCRIAPSAYISPGMSNSQIVHPLVVTAHPQEANQLALGLTDGLVKVIEPLETERKWGLPVPVNNGTENGKTAAPSTTNTSEQLQR
ncbi:hypothetical protein GOBAR_AA00035 [Gossypium barbadense]|uniref:CTLH domain-containing protein n=1 Tax=Gossypium barbadense TaxID=3634 RepID=A0A2P5YYC1_GOSBA|nr:hypothetical protein GOBAR_AA00035 [Gossypium barbadense]